MTDHEQPCRPGEHWFDRSRVTNEPVGACLQCGARLEWCEAQEEGDPEIGEDPTDVLAETDVEDGFAADKQALIAWGNADPETFGLLVGAP